MTTAATIHAAPRRRLAAAAIALLIATLVLVGPAAQRAFGASYTAYDQASWLAAVDDAMANTGEPNTITLTADFSVACSTLPCLIATVTSGASALTIDGGGHTITNTGAFRTGFLYSSSATSDITLQNVTLSGFDDAAAIYLSTSGDVTLDNVTVTNSGSDDSALKFTATNLLITESTFADNADFGVPGAAVNVTCSGKTTIENSTFTHNITYFANGGALYSSCAVEAIDSTFSNNQADGNGGAIYGAGTVRATRSTFTTNSADNGGAIYAVANIPAYLSTFTGNTATTSGGAIYSSSSNTTVERSTFTSNHADTDGGAAWSNSYGDSLQSTWEGNTAGNEGGAIFTLGTDDASYQEESTFVNNTAAGDGGAIYQDDDNVYAWNSDFVGNSDSGYAAHVYVNNGTINPYASVFGDPGTGFPGCGLSGPANSNGYNFDGSSAGDCTNGRAGTGDVGSPSTDPLLGSLADNGGPTETLLPQAGSPLIDAIPWAYCSVYSYTDYDQRTVVRALAGADVDGCDIGAVEVAPSSVSFTVAGAGGDIGVTLDNAYCYEDVTAQAIADLPGTPPAGVSFPFGAFTFSACTFPGDTITVHLSLPSPANVAYKVDDGGWTAIPGASFAGTSVTYSITDDGPFDQLIDNDPEEDDGGYVIDPVAAGIGAGFTG